MEKFFMQNSQKIFEITIPFIAFFSILFIGYILRKLVIISIINLSKKTKNKLAELLIVSIKGPFIFWCFIFSVYSALKLTNLPVGLIDSINKFLLVAGIFSITLVLANLSMKLIKVYSNKLETALPITSLTQNITRVIIFSIGVLIILNSLGISITPILATLGVGGLAVALALQETFSNLFAGFHIIVARQIKIGDYIKLDSGEEGHVFDINWRTTKVKMLPNNVVLVPNSKLIQAIVVNYYLPDKEMAVLVNLGVHYNSDLKKVEKITSEVGKEIMREVTGGVPEFDPFIRYHTFGDFSINFTVILRAKEFVDQYLIKHEFIKRLHERYSSEGIVIPYPIRAINYGQEKTGRENGE